MANDKSENGVPIFLPEKGEINRDSVWQWYQNIDYELSLPLFSPAEKNHIREYYEEAGLLRDGKVNFFRAHFAESFTAAAQYLLAGDPGPVVLDLGGGTGTQALYLAINGARVTVVDMDGIALEVLRKRVSWYSNLVGRALQVQCLNENTQTYDYGDIGPIDGVYSMFAFNMMQPSNQLLLNISKHLSRDSRLVVIDGNSRSWLARVFPSRKRAVWSPPEFARELKRLGFAVDEHEGAIVLPPFIWNVLPYRLAEFLDRSMRHNWFCPISHQVMARRSDP